MSSMNELVLRWAYFQLRPAHNVVLVHASLNSMPQFEVSAFQRKYPSALGILGPSLSTRQCDVRMLGTDATAPRHSG